MSLGMLTIMGSGETSPTMVTTHQAILSAFEPTADPAVLVDTPFGFQENADEITARALAYFSTRVGRHLEVASFRSADHAGVDGAARFEAALRTARFVFSGPGSPTYALEQWEALRVAELLAGTIAGGGAVTFASAAAVTLGRLALPVYEIYKAGRSPHWVPGLDVLGAFDIDAVVIPHFDNAEGGTHDTRYCYMGRRRLDILEALLPRETSVIGIDEHTAAIIDFGAGEVRITGKGRLTVRRCGGEVTLPAGATAGLSVLAGGSGGDGSPEAAPEATAHDQPAPPDLPHITDRAAAEFDAALDRGDAGAAAAQVLALDRAVLAWSADTLESDAGSRARSLLKEMIVRLGDAATEGLVDPRSRVAPFVELLLEVRAMARQRGDWPLADLVRDGLARHGVEVRDGPDGTDWSGPGGG